MLIALCAMTLSLRAEKDTLYRVVSQEFKIDKSKCDTLIGKLEKYLVPLYYGEKMKPLQEYAYSMLYTRDMIFKYTEKESLADFSYHVSYSYIFDYPADIFYADLHFIEFGFEGEKEAKKAFQGIIAKKQYSLYFPPLCPDYCLYRVGKRIVFIVGPDRKQKEFYQAVDRYMEKLGAERWNPSESSKTEN